LRPQLLQDGVFNEVGVEEDGAHSIAVRSPRDSEVRCEEIPASLFKAWRRSLGDQFLHLAHKGLSM
jgi:hypothetical protein